MLLDELHPLDAKKARRLGERLCDFSRGEVAARDDILRLASGLMVCTSPSCSDDGVSAVVDRLLLIADHRMGSHEMASAALAEVVLEHPPR